MAESVMSLETKRVWAKDAHDWFVAYKEAGFDEEQAFELVTASMGRTVLQIPTAKL